MIRRLPFVPSRHGWHFRNDISTDVVALFRTYGLCGGMCLSAINYFRHGLTMPSLRWGDIPSYGFVTINGRQWINVPTANPGQAHPVFDFIFHSQLATFESGNIHKQMVFPWDNNDPTHYRWSVQDEFPQIKAAIDRGHYVIIGLRSPTDGEITGHQTLVYGYDDDGGNRTLFMYDPNNPDVECIVTRGDGHRIAFSRADGQGFGTQWRSYYLQMELNPAVRSSFTTYDALRNQRDNFSVRPPYTDPVAVSPTGFAGNGTYNIQSKSTGRYLDIDLGFANLGGHANGDKLQVWDATHGDNQKFIVTDMGGGFWKITACHSHKCLDVRSASLAPVADVIQWDYHSGDNQLFQILPVTGPYWRIIARHSHQALDVYNNGQANGTKIVQYPYHGGDNQQWVFTRV